MDIRECLYNLINNKNKYFDAKKDIKNTNKLIWIIEDLCPPGISRDNLLIILKFDNVVLTLYETHNIEIEFKKLANNLKNIYSEKIVNDVLSVLRAAFGLDIIESSPKKVNERVFNKPVTKSKTIIKSKPVPTKPLKVGLRSQTKNSKFLFNHSLFDLELEVLKIKPVSKDYNIEINLNYNNKKYGKMKIFLVEYGKEKIKTKRINNFKFINNKYNYQGNHSFKSEFTYGVQKNLMFGIKVLYNRKEYYSNIMKLYKDSVNDWQAEVINI